MGAVSGVRLSALWPLPPTAPSAKRKGHAQRAALRCGDSTLRPQPVHMQYAHRACSPPPATHLRVPHPSRALCDGWDGTHSTSHNTLLLFCLSCCHPRRESAFCFVYVLAFGDQSGTSTPRRNHTRRAQTDLKSAVNYFSSFSAQKSHVKPQNYINHSNERKSSWHVSSIQPAILDIDRKIRSPGRHRTGAKLFDKTYLAITPLFGHI